MELSAELVREVLNLSRNGIGWPSGANVAFGKGEGTPTPPVGTKPTDGRLVRALLSLDPTSPEVSDIIEALDKEPGKIEISDSHFELLIDGAAFKSLNLDGINSSFSPRFVNCYFGAFRAVNAQFPNMKFLNCNINSLSAANTTIYGDLEVDGCENHQFIFMNGRIFGSCYYLSSFSKHYTSFVGADVRGQMIFEGNVFTREKPDDYCLAFHRANVSGDFRYQKNISIGAVTFSSFNVRNLWDDEASWPGSLNGRERKKLDALDRSNAKKIRAFGRSVGTYYLDGFCFENIIGSSPRTAKKRRRWLACQKPGFQDGPLFKPQPWKHLIGNFRKVGLDGEADKLALSFRRRLRKNDDFSGRIYESLFDFFAKYGYSISRPLGISAVLILFGAYVFFDAYKNDMIRPSQEEIIVYMDKRQTSETPPYYERFNPFMYSLDVFVPIFDFDQTDNWTARELAFDAADRGSRCKEQWELIPEQQGEEPAVQSDDPKERSHILKKSISGACVDSSASPTPLLWPSKYKLFMWFQIIAGWVMTTLVGFSVTGLARRE